MSSKEDLKTQLQHKKLLYDIKLLYEEIQYHNKQMTSKLNRLQDLIGEILESPNKKSKARPWKATSSTTIEELKTMIPDISAISKNK